MWYVILCILCNQVLKTYPRIKYPGEKEKSIDEQFSEAIYKYKLGKTLYRIGEWVYCGKEDYFIKVISKRFMRFNKAERDTIISTISFDESYTPEERERFLKQMVPDPLFLVIKIDIRTNDEKHTRQFWFTRLKVRAMETGWEAVPLRYNDAFDTWGQKNLLQVAKGNLFNVSDYKVNKIYKKAGQKDFNPERVITLIKYTPTIVTLVYEVSSMRGQVIYLYDNYWD